MVIKGIGGGREEGKGVEGRLKKKERNKDEEGQGEELGGGVRGREKIGEEKGRGRGGMGEKKGKKMGRDEMRKKVYTYKHRHIQAFRQNEMFSCPDEKA
jgi:hypothetical protein